MDQAARDTMEVHPDIVLAFGESDEYRYALRPWFLLLIWLNLPSFLLKRSTTIYNRRQSKILSTLTSQFTSSYVFHWSKYFPSTPLQYPPSFDGRIVLYPTEKEVKDYFAWRQADSALLSTCCSKATSQMPIISTYQQSLQYDFLGLSPTGRPNNCRSSRHAPRVYMLPCISNLIYL